MIMTPGELIVKLREDIKTKDKEIKELKKYNNKLIADNNMRLNIIDQKDEDIQELKSKINKVRQMAWEMDIPYPTIPEYVELHEKMQKIINYIDEEIYEGIEY